MAKKKVRRGSKALALCIRDGFTTSFKCNGVRVMEHKAHYPSFRTIFPGGKIEPGIYLP